MPLTQEQKEANKLARQTAKKEAAEAAKIEAEKNQKPVKSIKINIEWKKSRMWGHNPFLEAWISFKDGSHDYVKATCSGCGYDKESTVVADVFNQFLKYKLHGTLPPKLPYGMRVTPEYKYYVGGVGMSCYPRIAEAIGGKLENLASGRSFDAYLYTDNS